MKRRKRILWTLFLFYCLTAVLCLFFKTPLFSKKPADAAPVSSTDAALETLFEKPEQAEVNGVEQDTQEQTPSEQDTANASSQEETAAAPTDKSSANAASEAENAFSPVPFSCKTVFLPLNVRSMPSLTSPVIAKIRPGEQGMVTGIIDADWVSVLYQDTAGYCAARYLEYTLPQSPEAAGENGKLSDTQPDEPALPEQKASQGQTAKADNIKIIQGCYIRKEPDWRNPDVIIRVAEAGASYPHVPEKDAPSFYAIQLPDRSVAYVSVDYASLGE